MLTIWWGHSEYDYRGHIMKILLFEGSLGVWLAFQPLKCESCRIHAVLQAVPSAIVQQCHLFLNFHNTSPVPVSTGMKRVL